MPSTDGGQRRSAERRRLETGVRCGAHDVYTKPMWNREFCTLYSAQVIYSSVGLKSRVRTRGHLGAKARGVSASIASEAW